MSRIPAKNDSVEFAQEAGLVCSWLVGFCLEKKKVSLPDIFPPSTCVVKVLGQGLERRHVEEMIRRHDLISSSFEASFEKTAAVSFLCLSCFLRLTHFLRMHITL